jgi:hypothetical protein
MNILSGSRSGRRIIFVALCLTLIWLTIFFCRSALASSAAPTRVGGPCAYKPYQGEAEIVSVKLNPDRPGTYEIKFLFHPQDVIQEKFAGVEGRPWLLVLQDSSNPNEDFVRQYGIQTGKRFPCVMNVITKGTCTPILFDFPTLNSTRAP